MSERYKPKNLVREAKTPEFRMRANYSRSLVDEAQRLRRAKLEAKLQNPRIVTCHHNVFWLDCQICSKPKR